MNFHQLEVVDRVKLCLADAIHNFKWVKMSHDLPEKGRSIFNCLHTTAGRPTANLFSR